MFQSVAYIFTAFLLLSILGICKGNSKKFLNKRVSQKFWNEAVTVSKAIPGGNRYKIHNQFIFLFLECLSALCGLLASAGGTIFKFEDGLCSVGNYLGSPTQYEDGQESISYFLINYISVLKEPLNSVYMLEGTV